MFGLPLVFMGIAKMQTTVVAQSKVTPFRCNHCGQVLGQTDQYKLFSVFFNCTKLVTLECHNCGRPTKWSPLRPEKLEVMR